jgi:DNA-binding NarL/FixJ family response regulator
MGGLRVVVAEDHFLVRRGLSDVVGAEETLELAGVCDSLPDLLDTVDRACPDVVITDVRMPPTSTDEGIRAAEIFRHAHPRLAVLVLSQYADPAYVLALLRAGTRRRGYLLKQHLADPGQLRTAAHAVASGGSFIDPDVVRVWAAAQVRRGGSPIVELTGRESQVLAEMAGGRNNAAIAGSLGISERAVEKHINSIFAKLGVTGDPGAHRRVAAVLAYLGASGPQRTGLPAPGYRHQQAASCLHDGIAAARGHDQHGGTGAGADR